MKRLLKWLRERPAAILIALVQCLLLLFIVPGAPAARVPPHAVVRSMQSPVFVTVKDAYEVHERLVIVEPDGSQVLVGEFYVVEPGDVRAVCAGGAVQTFNNLQGAANYVRHCAVPK